MSDNDAIRVAMHEAAKSDRFFDNGPDQTRLLTDKGVFYCIVALSLIALVFGV